MPHNKEIEEIMKEFENMGHSHLYPEGVINGSCFYCRHCKSNDFICKDCLRNFLQNTLTSYGKSQYDKGVEEERKEWLKGNRCSACGDSNLESGGLSDVCNNCVEDQ